MARADKKERWDSMSSEDGRNDGGVVTHAIVEAQQQAYPFQRFATLADLLVRDEITVLLQKKDMLLKNALIDTGVVALPRSTVIEQHDRSARRQHALHWEVVAETPNGPYNLGQPRTSHVHSQWDLGAHSCYGSAPR